MRSRLTAGVVSTLLFGMLACVPAHAAFPGANGKIAFSRCCGYDLMTMNPDGSGQSTLATPRSGFFPAWSPDGTRIAYSDGGIATVKADGSDFKQVTPVPPCCTTDRDVQPAWSPDGTRIAFARVSEAGTDLYIVNADGTGLQPLTSDGGEKGDPAWSLDGRTIAFDENPSPGDLSEYLIKTIDPDGSGEATLTGGVIPNWSPDGRKLTFAQTLGPDGPYDVYVSNADGSGKVNITNDPADDTQPAWSPDGKKIVFLTSRYTATSGWDLASMNPDGTGVTNLTQTQAYEENPDWQPIQRAYVRPKGATPVSTHLTVAYNPCAAPTTTHGAPLAFPSCSPPVPASDYLTVGTPDANGQPSNSTGLVRYGVVLGNPATPADEADVTITVDVRDVRKRSDLSDYTGELQATALLRITDKDNGAGPGGSAAATVTDTPFPAIVPCAATPDTAIGSTCELATSADAILPGIVKEGRRAIWELGQAQVYDGGADGDGSTIEDNTLFMDEGIFVP